MDLGIYSIDDTLAVMMQCVNGSRVATAPSSTPTHAIYDNSGTSVTTGSFGASDHDSKTGLRRLAVTLSVANGFSSGKHFVRGEYVISGTTYAVLFSFTIV